MGETMMKQRRAGQEGGRIGHQFQRGGKSVSKYFTSVTIIAKTTRENSSTTAGKKQWMREITETSTHKNVEGEGCKVRGGGRT